MYAWRLGISVAAVAAMLLACGSGKKKDERGARGGEEKLDKQAVCAQLWRQTMGGVQMAVTAVGGGAGGELSPEEAAELEAVRGEWMTQCLAWPDEAFECLKPGADDSSPACLKAAAAIEGVLEIDPKAPMGPEVAWTAKLAEARTLEALPMVAGADGRVALAPRGEVVMLSGEGTVWTAPVDHDGWLAQVGEGEAALLLTSESGAVVAIEPGSGKLRWRAPLPEAAGETVPEDDRSVEGVAVAGTALWLVTADGRFFRVEPAACPKRKACVTAVGRLGDEDGTLDDVELLPLGAEMLLLSTGSLRRLEVAAPVATRFALVARDVTGGVARSAGGRLAAVIDGELLVLDPGACVGRLQLPARRGTLTIEPCDDCAPPPRGCVTARVAAGGDVDSVAPTWIGEETLAVAAEGKLALAGRGGKLRWRADVGVVGRVLHDAARGRLYALSFTGAEGDRLRVVAVDASSGALLWQRDLGLAVPGMLVSHDDLHLALAGPWLFAGFKQDLTALLVGDGGAD